MKATQVKSYLGAETVKNDSVIEGLIPNPFQHEFLEDSLEIPQILQTAFRESIHTHLISSIISVIHKLE